MKKHIAITLAAAAIAALACYGTSIAARSTASHMEDYTNPSGCSACHSGLGKAGTPMLKKQTTELCFECHGSWTKGVRKSLDIETVINKDSHHPIIETGYLHDPFEKLPTDKSSDQRHVACADCHKVHLSSQNKPTKGARGYMPSKVRGYGRGSAPIGIRLTEAMNDYELCYLCHSDSANLPSDSRNVAEEFDPTNASYHPVEMDGKNKFVPSLVSGITENSTIGCSDCHGNNEPNGAKGPHGSEYSPILLDQYKTEDGPEGRDAYQLCYNCHSRTSIIGDESFKRHKLHVVTNEYSCHNCHNAHGSRENESLILFDEDVVSASGTSGGPEFLPGAGGMPKCSLSCHGVDHSSTKVGDKAWPW